MTHSVESSVTAGAALAAPKTLDHGIPLHLASNEALIHILDRYPSAQPEYDSRGDQPSW